MRTLAGWLTVNKQQTNKELNPLPTAHARYCVYPRNRNKSALPRGVGVSRSSAKTVPFSL